MKRSNLLIGFYLVLIFASGVTVGVFATNLYMARVVSSKGPAKPSPEEFRREYVNEMQTRLNLTPEQMTKFNQVLDETGSKFHAERERHNQDIKTIREEHVNRVKALLTEAQLPQYEQLRKEREERAKKNQAKK
jgi:excinuclease UvrABC helicase subunit UvrB